MARRFRKPIVASRGGKPNRTGTISFSKPIPRVSRSVIAGLVLGGVVATAAGAPQLGSDLRPDAAGRLVSDDGTIDLHWAGEGAGFELQQSQNASFGGARTRYRGPDRATVISGLADGVYHFRVRADSDAAWSAPLVLHVESMERPTLFALLGTGAFVALCTIGAILHGHFKSR